MTREEWEAELVEAAQVAQITHLLFPGELAFAMHPVGKVDRYFAGFFEGTFHQQFQTDLVTVGESRCASGMSARRKAKNPDIGS